MPLSDLGRSIDSGGPYARPRAPVLPVFSFGSPFGGGDAAYQSVLNVSAPLLVASGRAALALALKDIGVSHSDSVLVPAYSCPSVLNPIKWCGARAVFYKVRENLEIDFEDLVSKVEPHTRAIIAIHYFGFPQDLARLRSLCDRRGIPLIEDCAHALFEANGRNVLGRVGDYVVGSLVKFYPISDGGFLASSRRTIDVHLHGGGVKYEIKSWVNLLETSFSYERLRPLNWLLAIPLRVKDWLWLRAKDAYAREPTDSSIAVASPRHDFDFDPAHLGVRASGISRALIRSTSIRRLTKRRRQNYRRLTRALTQVRGCRPLLPNLPSGVVPYMFPLVVDDPARVFPRLKHAGIPIFRWEAIETDACEISIEYSKRLLQIPCHQELTLTELEWIIETVRAESGENAQHALRKAP